MFIDELTEGQQITISAKVGTEVMKFETAIRGTISKRHIVLADPVLVDDKVVGFGGSAVTVNIECALPDSPPLIFQDVRIILTKTKEDGNLYAISSQNEGKSQNRRNNFRLFVGKRIVVQCGQNHSTYDAVLHDVSNSGFSFIVNKIGANKDKFVDFHENMLVHTVFSDRIEETFTNYDFNMTGIIVRVVEMEENGSILYGCMLNNKVPGLDSYIATKERLRIKLDR